MFGKKGLPASAAIEAAAVNFGSNVAVFDERLYVEESRLEELSAGEGGRIIVLGGSGPGDLVYISE